MKDIIHLDSISQLHKALAYAPPKHPQITKVNFNEIQVSIEMTNRKFVCGYYVVILKKQTHCELKYGRKNYDFEEGSMLFMKPGQAIEYDDVVGTDFQSFEGWGLFFHPDLIRKSFLAEKMKEYTFFSYESNEALHLSDDEKKIITNIVDGIEKEYQQNIDVYSRDVIISNLELLLSHSKRFYGRQFITRKTQNEDVLSKFENLISEYYSKDLQVEQGIPSVQYFSEKLNLSAPYLTDLLKQETGKNTQEHIHLYVIERAKNRLLNSNNSVSEIAHELGFEYPQYFSRVFKKKVGMSPAEYRNVI